MLSSDMQKASHNRDFILTGYAKRPASVASHKTAGPEAIMQQFVKKIRAPFFMVLLLAFVAGTGNPQAWSQNPSSATSAKVEQAAAAPAAPAEAVVPARKNLSVPVIGSGDLLKISILG